MSESFTRELKRVLRDNACRFDRQGEGTGGVRSPCSSKAGAATLQMVNVEIDRYPDRSSTFDNSLRILDLNARRAGNSHQPSEDLTPARRLDLRRPSWARHETLTRAWEASLPGTRMRIDRACLVCER